MKGKNRGYCVNKMKLPQYYDWQKPNGIFLIMNYTYCQLPKRGISVCVADILPVHVSIQSLKIMFIDK